MALNYTDEPDFPLPQANPQADPHEQVRWEDLESYVGSSDDDSLVGSQQQPRGPLASRWSALRQEYQTSLGTQVSAEDVQWFYVVIDEPRQELDGFQVLIFAVLMFLVLLISALMIWILIT